jgi:hypothetical protein
MLSHFVVDLLNLIISTALLIFTNENTNERQNDFL